MNNYYGIVKKYRTKKQNSFSIFLWFISSIAFALISLWILFSSLGLHFIFNATDSLEGYVFMLGGSGTPYRGALIAFQPPKNDFYRHIKFIKYVVGIPGDRVTRRGREFFINGKFIGAAKEFSKKGVSLKASEPGVIPHGKVFVWTPHPDSFDSRYAQIGLLDQKNIIGFVSRFL